MDRSLRGWRVARPDGLRGYSRRYFAPDVHGAKQDEPMRLRHTGAHGRLARHEPCLQHRCSWKGSSTRHRSRFAGGWRRARPRVGPVLPDAPGVVRHGGLPGGRSVFGVRGTRGMVCGARDGLPNAALARLGRVSRPGGLAATWRHGRMSRSRSDVARRRQRGARRPFARS